MVMKFAIFESFNNKIPMALECVKPPFESKLVNETW